MTAVKKASKKKRQPAPGTTAVKDRVAGVPLWREAHSVATFLRACGADPAQALADIRDHAALSERRIVRGRDAKKVPMWVLDLAVAILEQIPQRSLRKPGRPKTDAVRNVEFWTEVMKMPVAEAARMVATLEARQSDDDKAEDGIEERAEQLAHEVYRHRKPDVT